jgi:hypothetical protein
VASLVSYAGILLLYYGLILVIVAVHEGGHVLAGLIVGFRLKEVRVGPVLVTWNAGGKRSWKWDRRRRALGTGRARMSPGPESWSGIGLRYSLYVLAGPMSNLLSAAMALPLAMRSDLPGTICKYFMGFSVLVGLFNLIPRQGLDGPSDGRILFQFLFRPKRREERLFRFCLGARLEEARRLRHESRIREAYRILRAQLELADKYLNRESDKELKKNLDALRNLFAEAMKTPDQQADSIVQVAPSLNPAVESEL